MTAEIPYEAPIMPRYAGRFSGGARKATRMKAPEKTPAAPSPAMARPTIKAVLFGATAGGFCQSDSFVNQSDALNTYHR